MDTARVIKCHGVGVAALVGLAALVGCGDSGEDAEPLVTYNEPREVLDLTYSATPELVEEWCQTLSDLPPDSVLDALDLVSVELESSDIFQFTGFSADEISAVIPDWCIEQGLW